MESEIASPIDAKVSKISVKERSLVQEGDILMILEGEEVKTAPSTTRKHNKPQNTANFQPVVAPQPNSDDLVLSAPIPGTIIDVKVSLGQSVNEGDVALVLEAMKMESDIHFLRSGKVSKIHINRGDNVQEGDPLIELEG